MVKIFSLVILAFSLNLYSYSQVTVIIKNAETGKTLPGATILFNDSGEGTSSDAEGKFETEYRGQISISAIGYKTKIAEIHENRNNYTFLLQPEYYQLDEVVVEAFNRSRRLVDVPGSLSLIQAHQIERENPVTVVPLLNQAPGVFAHSGALNTSRITIRGIGARVPYATGKVRAYLNNIPLTNGSGISIVEDIDPSVMERIEIIKGPATSVYGAGLGGTIIITAKDPTLKPASITNNFHAGSWDLYRNTLSVNAAGDNLGVSLLYNHTQSNGYRQNNRYRRDGITAVAKTTQGDKTDITLLLSYTSLKAHIPSSIDSMTYMTSPRSAAQNWLQTRGYEDYDKLLAGVSATYDLTNNLSANLSLFSTMNEEKEMRPFDVLYEDRLSAGSRFKLSYSGLVPAGSWQILGGGEVYAENFKYTSHENIGGLGERGEIFSDNAENISYFNIFSQADLDLNRLNASAGININSSKTNYRDLFHEGNRNPSGRYTYGIIVSPRLSANYRYYGNNSVFITLSHGFSPPSLSETLTPEGFINPEIKPETSWNFEGGLRGNLFNHRLFYDLNIFRMQVTNLLVAERVGEDAWVGRNAGESMHTGAEAELHLILYRNNTAGNTNWWQPEELSASPNITLNNFRFTDFFDEGVDYSGNYLPGIPDHIINTGIYGSLQGGLYGLVNFRRVGKMPMNDENSLYAGSYFITNATIGYKREIAGNLMAEGWLSAGNLFDAKYASMILVNAPEFGNRPPRYYYPGNPLNFSAGLRISYQLN